MLGSLSHFKMILRQSRSLMQQTRNEMESFPFTTCRSRLTIPAVSTNQNLIVSAFSCIREPWSKATIGVVLSLSSSNSSIRCCPPTPRPSTQAAHQLLWTAFHESSCSCFSLRILRMHSDSGNFCVRRFLIFFVSHFDICTRFYHWFDVIHHQWVLHLDS